MAAHVEHRFERGFLLDEERLRKLVNIISERLGKMTPSIPYGFRVFRADSYSYETSSVDDVIREDNTDWRRIISLQIEGARGKEFEFSLTFSDDGTDLSINGDDRDQVFLLFSDLREYLKNEINTCGRRHSRDWSIVFAIAPVWLLVLLVTPFVWGLSRHFPGAAAFQVALDSQDIAEKLNLLIQLSKKSEIVLAIRYLFPAAMLLCTLPFFAQTGAADKIISYFRPSNVFLFGPQKLKFDQRRHLAGKLLWGGCIAFLMSLLAGLAVWWMTK